MYDNELLHSLAFSKPVKRYALFMNLPVSERGGVLAQLSSRVRRALLENIPDEDIITLLHYPDVDTVMRIVRDIKDKRRKKLIIGLARDMRDKVETLLRFKPGTAASIMDLDYVIVDYQMRCGDVLQIMGAHEKRTGKTPAVLVTKEGFLVGELPLYALVSKKSNELVGPLARKMPSMKYDASYVRVLDVFRGNPRRRVAVLDNDKSIIGIIHSHDILDILDAKSGSGLYEFAGVRKEEDMRDPWTRKVRNRSPWLVINLGTVLVAAFVVGIFEETIESIVLLAVYMPIIAGMGGNAGMQTLAVVVRGLAGKDISFRMGARIAANEITAGIVNGLITGGLVTLVAIFLNKNPLLGVIALFSIVVNIIVAGIFGTFAPIIMQKTGRDPATSASIFITTATDVFGFLIFLGLAKAFLT